MNLALNLLGLLLTAALGENPFYTRCFMAETVDAQLNERRDVMLRSIIAAGMCLPAAISGWPLPVIPIFLFISVPRRASCCIS